MAKKEARITRIRLIQPMPFGSGALMEQHVGVDSLYFGSNSKIAINFDTDDRFLRVDIGEWSGLIPLSNVGMIQLAPVM